MRLWRFVMFAPLAVVACGGAVTSTPDATGTRATGAPTDDAVDGVEPNAIVAPPTETADAAPIRDASTDIASDVAPADAVADVVSDEPDAPAPPPAEASICTVGAASFGVRDLRYCGSNPAIYLYGYACQFLPGEELATTNTTNSLHCNWFSEKNEMECLCDFSVVCGRPVTVSRTTAPDEATMLSLWTSMCGGSCQRCNDPFGGSGPPMCPNTDSGVLYTCFPDAGEAYPLAPDQ